MAEVVMKKTLLAGDVVGGGRDWFGAKGPTDVILARNVSPFSIGPHAHAVIARDPVRLTLSPVCERAVLLH